MNLQRLLRGDPGRNSLLYLGIGGISLVKALAVRDDSERFRRELLDAGLFIGVGLLLRRYSTMREQKRAELQEQIPDWVVDVAGSTGAQSGLRSKAKRRLTSGAQAETKPTLGEHARSVLKKR